MTASCYGHGQEARHDQIRGIAQQGPFPGSGTPAPVRCPSLPARDIDPYDYDSLNGFFQIWSGAFLAIFTVESLVFFVRDHDILPIKDMRFDVAGPLDAREFTAWHQGRLLCRLTDSVHDHGYIEGDPTAFTEMEDFDFGLYAQRVAAQVQA